MTSTVTITIEGNDLDAEHDGDWTITIAINGSMSAQAGLSGTPLHAIAAAHELAIENELIEEPPHD